MDTNTSDVIINIDNFKKEVDKIKLPILKPSGPKSYQIPFPFSNLPTFPRDMISIISPTTLAPDEFIVTALLSSMSSVIGTRAYIQLGRRIFYPALWSMLIAPSSDSFKSTALWEARKFILNIDKEYQKTYRNEYAEYERQLLEYQLLSPEVKINTEKPVEPTRKEIDFSDDETLESFYQTLHDNPDGGLLTFDELGGWLENFNKYNRGTGEKRRWLTIFDNRSIKYKRKLNHTHLTIDKPFVSLSGGITLNTFTTLFKDSQSEIESGFLPRFIFCKTPSFTKLDYSFFRPDIDTDKWEKAYQVFKNASELRSGAVAPVKEGREMLDDWYFMHEKERRRVYFPCELLPFWRRLEGYLLKFALIFHQFKRVTGEVDSNVINTQTITEAISVTNYYKGQAQAIVEELFKTHEDKQKDHIIIFLQKVGGKATPREIQQSVRAFKGDKDKLKQILKELADDGKIDINISKKESGQKTTQITLKDVYMSTPSQNA